MITIYILKLALISIELTSFIAISYMDSNIEQLLLSIIGVLCLSALYIGEILTKQTYTITRRKQDATSL